MSSSTKRFDVVIVGETNLDLILYGLPEEMPVNRELLGTGFTVTLGGSSSILAHNLATLGTKTAFVSEVGEDSFGRLALDELQSSGADLSEFRRKPGKSSGVTVILPHVRDRHILTYPGVMSELTVDDLDLDYLKASRHFHLSSLFLQTGLHAGLPELFDALRTAGLTISLDTNDDPSGTWRGVLDVLLDKIDVLLPNEEELLRIADASTLEASLDKLSSRIPLIAVKCGSRGAVLQQGSRREWVPPLTVTPVDSIGAGDSFNAGFLHEWLQTNDPLKAVTFANVTGALSTLASGGIAAHRKSEMRSSFLARHVLVNTD
jgi:sugar/nucleoside kinase (ribokinase family)